MARSTARPFVEKDGNAFGNTNDDGVDDHCGGTQFLPLDR